MVIIICCSYFLSFYNYEGRKHGNTTRTQINVATVSCQSSCTPLEQQQYGSEELPCMHTPQFGPPLSLLTQVLKEFLYIDSVSSKL